MVEEIMDDEDEVRDLNLSSRPLREERRRRRDRERLERGIVARSHHFAEGEMGVSHRPPAARAPWQSNGAVPGSTSQAADEAQHGHRQRLEADSRCEDLIQLV